MTPAEGADPPAVIAVHSSDAHTFSKTTRPEIELVAGLGVAGDAHMGARVRHRSRVAADPTQPNLRQVHLMHAELFDRVVEAGHDVGPGDLGENITTRGVDLLGLAVGTMLQVGEALLAVTGLRNPCGQINEFQEGLLSQVLVRDETGELRRLAGIMAVVVHGGVVRPGDAIVAAAPPGPFRPLERV
ncbi:MAG: MOSC domain-containing protein [Actinomycetota bacterium]